VRKLGVNKMWCLSGLCRAWLWGWLVLVLVAAPAYAAAAETPRFDVLEFVVSGNTALPPELVETTLQPFMGPGKTIKDLELAREALEKTYQDAGFLSVLVSLPNQQLGAAGEVRLDVTQARIEQMRVTGAQYHRPSLIQQQLPSLQPSSVPYFPQVQKELSQVQTGNLQLTPLLSGGSKPDLLNMEVKVQDSAPWVASAELDNRQSFNTSQGRLSLVLSHLNLFQKRHRLGLSWQYAPWRPADANTLSLIYGLPLTPQDDLSLSFTKSDSDTPISVGSGGNTITKGEFVGVRWSHALPARQWPVQHSVSVGVDYKNNRDTTQLVDELSSQKPPLRYTTLSLGYSLRWLPAEGESLDVSTTGVVSNQALSGRMVDCEGDQVQQFECKRSGARPDFLAWKFMLDWNSPLWGASDWRVSAHADLQLASGPLVSGEQYSLGGVDTVRGYYDYEQSGDRGWNTRLEIISPPRTLAGNWRLQALVFWDRGYVALQDALEGQVASAHLGSLGLGLRSNQVRGLSWALDVAHPNFVTQRAESNSLAVNTDKRWRAHVSAKQSF
jgi:hemolysin activation/secretion protein